jgi:lysophospholipase L1-like esterase
VAALIQKISASGAQVFWILPPKLEYDEKVAPMVRKHEIPVFESTQYPIKQQPDKIHATSEGYRFWANEIVKKLTCKEDKK